MKILVTGTRGIPDILGGVETHCEELYPRITNLQDIAVTVVTRSPYVENKQVFVYKKIRLKHLYAPKIKSLEAIVHTFLAVVYAGIKRPDILHIHAVGPMLMAPLAKLVGLKVVVTHHGPDYNRQKWGFFAKKVLRLGEFLGVKFADKVIVISQIIANDLNEKFGFDKAILIPNGVNLPLENLRTDYLESLGLQKGNYILGVGRFVEEKGFHDLIAAYKNAQTDFKLVIAGDADHPTQYSEQLKKMALEQGIVLTGFVKGEKLDQIFRNTALYVMPSYHEGLPIALLEAMSYNLKVLVSDIKPNLEVGLHPDNYFQTGNIVELAGKIDALLQQETQPDYKTLLKEKYSWDQIAQKTFEVYQSVC